MKRTTSTLLSLGVSAILIAAGVWYLYDHNKGLWTEKARWSMGALGMMGGGGMGIVMIIFWVVLVGAFVLLIAGAVSGIRGSKQKK